MTKNIIETYIVPYCPVIFHRKIKTMDNKLLPHQNAD